MRLFLKSLLIVLLPVLMFARNTDKMHITADKILQIESQRIETRKTNGHVRINKNAQLHDRQRAAKENTLLMQRQPLNSVDSRVQLSKTADGEFMVISRTYQYRENNAWVNDIRYNLSYNSNNLFVEELVEYWDNNRWNNSEIYVYGYDNNGNFDELLHQDWDGVMWINHWVDSWIYDNNGNQIEYLYREWNEVAWENLYKRDSEYDDNNNETLFGYYDWVNSAWQPSIVAMLTYNDNNLHTEGIFEYYTDGLFDGKDRWQYQYDEANRLTEQTISYWDTEWINDVRWLYTFEGDNNTETLFQGWDGAMWQNRGKDVWLFDVNNNNIEYHNYEWVEGVWEDRYKSLSTYNMDNQLIEQSDEQWDQENSVWTGWYSALYTYENGNNTITEVHYYFWDEAYKYFNTFDSDNNLTETTTQIFDVFWTSVEKVLYTYSAITAIKPGFNSADKWRLAENYPNPFNPQTSIEFSVPQTSFVTVKVYNIQGQEVKELLSGYKTPGNHTVVWDATNNSGEKVASGAYMYRLVSDTRVLSRKMILIK